VPRFDPQSWKPTDDSSPGYRTLDSTCVVLKVWYDPESGAMGCPCGCDDIPSGLKANFCMGHDARLRGILIRAHLMGVRIRYYMGDVLGDPTPAEDIATQYHWRSYLDGAVMRREGKNREVLRRALNSERLIQVGRWQYTGQVAAVYRLNGHDMAEIEYVNQAGDAKKIRVPLEDAPPVQQGES
jgi:hypothetical protein